MNLLTYTTKLKNYIKTKFESENRVYTWMQTFYRHFIFPIERHTWKNKNGFGFESEAALYMCSLLPKKTLDIIIKNYQPKTWLDVGCGTGSSLKYVKKHGIKITGLENSELAIKASNLNDVIRKCDLTQPVNLKNRFDLVWCYEVAEHLPEEAADTLIDTLTDHSDCIVLSAAVPGQGGEGHVNEQYSEYWILKMKDRGFIVDETITTLIHSLNELYSGNVYCFKKSVL
jgi:2-polyprenyl-3-methyl-5-hydroxy-6-metoxy-1,4-benzoquinol methylase